MLSGVNSTRASPAVKSSIRSFVVSGTEGLELGNERFGEGFVENEVGEGEDEGERFRVDRGNEDEEDGWAEENDLQFQWNVFC